MMHDYANSLDNSLVQFAHEQQKAKSVGRGMTFSRDFFGLDDIKTAILSLAEDVATCLREVGLKCSTVQVTIRDPQFKTITRQRKLNQHTYLLNEIVKSSIQILKAEWDMDEPIRMLTITGTNLVSDNDAK